MSPVAQPSAAQSGAPLAGIRVLDVSTMLAGPYGATLLGDMGADVIKVESFYGDDSRHLGPERNGQRSPFIAMNRNKRSLKIDLRQAAAQETFARLLATADILITNIRGKALAKLGLEYEQVRLHREDIIWVGVTAFGPDGPYAGRPGIDFLAQGYAGLLSLNGEPAQPPVRVTVPVVDVMTSLLVSSGALAALHARAASGQGQRIDVSLLDALVHAQAPGLAAYNVAGEITPRTGNRSQYFSPSGVYECGDGKGIVITCPSQKFFANLCAALDVAWIDDARFATIEARLANEDALDEVLGGRCHQFVRDELLEKLIAADVLTAPIQGVAEMAEDAQIRHNNMLVPVDHPALGQVKVTGIPLQMHGTPGGVFRHPPLHGEHNQEILTELGYDAEGIRALVEQKVIGA